MSTAALLLERVLATDTMDVATLARELVVSERTLRDYQAGTVEMPLERQICLAKLMLDRTPSVARKARALLGQIEATIAFNNAATEVHLSAPMPARRFR